MPQIGWLEILSVVIIAILVLGPKEFPIALKKIKTKVIEPVKSFFILFFATMSLTHLFQDPLNQR